MQREEILGITADITVIDEVTAATSIKTEE